MNFVKKIIVFAAAAISLFMFSDNVFAAYIANNSSYNIMLNGEKIDFAESEMPINVDGRIMLPLRFFFSQIDNGAGIIDWNDDESKITITLNETTAELWIGKSDAVVNGEIIAITDPMPIIYNQLTYVPVRFLSKVFDMEIGWSEYTSTVSLTSVSKAARIKELLDSKNNQYDINSKIEAIADTKTDITLIISTSENGEKIKNDEISATLNYKISAQMDGKNNYIHFIHEINDGKESAYTIETYDNGELTYTKNSEVDEEGWTYAKSTSTQEAEYAKENGIEYYNLFQLMMSEYSPYVETESDSLFYALKLYLEDNCEIVEGTIALTDEKITDAIIQLIEMFGLADLSLAEFNLLMDEPVYVKFVFNNNETLESMNVQYGITITYSFDIGNETTTCELISSFDIDVPRMIVDAEFESIVPEEIVNSAVNSEIAEQFNQESTTHTVEEE